MHTTAGTLFTVFLALLGAGCASVPLAPADADLKAKEFQTEQGRATLYVYREPRMHGVLHETQLHLNGRLCAALASGTYVFFSLPPGEYTLTSLTEKVATLNLKLGTDELYFVEQRLHSGGWARPPTELKLVSDEIGQKQVLRCKLAPLIPNSF